MAIVRKPAQATLNDWPVLVDGLRRAEQRINDWTQSPQAFLSLLGQVYGADPSPRTPPATWQTLRQTLRSGGLQPVLEIREDWEMPGLAGAYQAPTASLPQGRILLNRRWLTKADAASVEAVLLEEFGHAIDQQLNGSKDTIGDEGERLSALLRGQAVTAASRQENDSRELLIDGQRIRIEGSTAPSLPSVTLSLPTSGGSTAPARTAFGGSTILLDSNLALGGLAGNPTRMLVHFGRGYVKDEDQLVIVGTLPPTITSSFNAAKGILTLQPVSGQIPSQTEWRDALRAVGYRNLKSSTNPPQTPTAGERELVITTGELPALFINGQAHFYQYKTAPSIGDSNRWQRAKDAATTSTYAGLTGYLATITSADENAFITRTLLPDTGRTWLGGSDAGTEGQWKWEAGSASPESASTSFSQTITGNNTSKAVGTQYVNWASGEGTGTSDDYLSIGSNGMWADDAESNSSHGYLVEYSPGTGSADSTQRITLKPVAAASDQTFSVSDYTTQSVQGSGAQSSYTLSNATVDINLFGGGTLKVKATSVTISNGKIVSLQGSATASSLYGLSDVNLSAINLSASTRSITGKAKIGDQEINLSGNLKLESNGRYSFADLTGSLSNDQLKALLPSDGYLSQLRNGGFTFKRNAAGTSLDVAIKGIASFDARPDLADVSTPFDVRLANGVFSNGKLSAMELQRVGTAPWKLKLGENEMTVNGETITYKREVVNPAAGSSDPATIKHLYTLDLNGDLRQSGGDVINVDGLLTYGSSSKGSDPITLLPSSGSFDILNTRPFTIGTTQLNPGGGLKLKYQEDQNRKYGLLDVSGEAKIDLEIMKGVDVKFGKDNQDLVQLIQNQAANLKASDWQLGNLSNAETESTSGKDLGLAKYSSIKIESGSSIPVPRFYDSANQSSPTYTQGENSLIQAFNTSLGLYQVSSIRNKLTDQFTIKGADGTAISTVTIDIESSDVPGSPSLSRQQTLTAGEKYKIYQYLDKIKSEVSAKTIFVPDSVISPKLEDAYKDKKELFKAETIATQYGSVSIDDKGKWTYTQDTAKTGNLGSSTALTPRISSATPVKATLSDVDLDLSSLVGGSASWAEFQLSMLQTLLIVPIVKGLETKIPLDWSSAVKNVLAGLLENSPYNAYVDGEVQVIEVLDSIFYAVTKYQQLKGGSVNLQKYIPLSPGIKALGAWIRNAENILSLRASAETPGSEANWYLKNKLFPALSEDPWKTKTLDLNLDYKSDSPIGGSKWLNQAYINYDYSTKKPIEKDTPSNKLDTRDAQIMYAKSKKEAVTPKNMWDKGKTGGGASPSLGFNIDYTFPALNDPQKFVRDLFTGDRVTTSGFGLNLSMGLDLSWRQQIIPIFAAIFGFEVALKWALNWNSSYSQAELIGINENIIKIKNTESLSQEEKQKKINAYMGDMLKRTMTDLEKEYFSASFGPYIAGELGIPLLNLTLKLGVTPKFTITRELWNDAKVVDGKVVSGKLADDQMVNLQDYYDNPQTKRYGYDPKLESLTFHLEHNYDFLLAQGPKDPTGYKSFKEAYTYNTWLFNIGFKPLDLRSLIGKSKLSYDVSLLKKMETPADPITGIKGIRDISKFEWVSFTDPSIVTSGGIDFLFKEAKQLNSAVSKAFRNALQKQYPTLTEKEISRLLSLIIDNAIPTKVDYSLADSKDIEGRIEAMKKAYTVSGSRGMNENNYLEKDVFRYHVDGADGHSVTDNYSHYKLATPKYISINPKLDQYNYVQIDFNLISTKDQLDAGLEFFDGEIWQSIGSINDTLKLKSDANNSRAAIRLQSHYDSIDLSFIEGKDAKEKKGSNAYIHNSGTLSLRLSLAHMDDPTSYPVEQSLLRQAKAGTLQLRLQDKTTSGLGNDTTYLGDVGIQRGGSIYSKSSDPSASLRQETPLSWGSQLDSGTVAWVAPTFFRPLSDRSDLDGLTNLQSWKRTNAIKERLNPNLPLSIQMGLEKLNAASTTHLSNDQSGSLSDAVQGSVRFTKDPITQTTYKSYIGADRRVRVAARLSDDSDWVDIATIDTGTTGGVTLNLRPDETMAPDLVAINNEIMLASWDFQGNLKTYTLTKSEETGRYGISSSIVDSVRLDSITASGSETTNNLKTSNLYESKATNNNLRIGIEKRLDLISTTGTQQGFYVSVLDPVRQVYGTSAKALKIQIPDYETVSNTETLGNMSNGWIASSVHSAELKDQLRSLLGFGEQSTSGVFSGKGSKNWSGNVGTIKAADFIEYSSSDALSRHFGEWGSGSVFVAAANDTTGEGMIWNYDGDAYYAKNKDRSNKEATTSSGRVYTLNGLNPSSLSVVYRIPDQKDSLVSNWQGLEDQTTAVYQQVSNQQIRTASNVSTDSLIAGGNFAILAVGSAKSFGQYHQSAGTASQIGANNENDYNYTDGSLIARYISPQRFTGSDGVNYWYDASNVAPLSVEAIRSETTDKARSATATLNTGGNAGGLGWVWTPARQPSFGVGGLPELDDLQTRTGLDFIDSNSLNLALMSPTVLGTSGQTLKLNASSLQLLPTDLTPELFLDLNDGNKTVQRLSAKAESLSETGVVLTGAELLNASSPIEDRSPRSFDIIRSLFNGTRPYVERGEYIPLGYYTQEGKIYYGNINAPVETTKAQSSIDNLFRTLNGIYPQTILTGKPANGYAVVPLGFEGTISDYINYGVDSGSGSALLKLIQKMPTVVPDGYFKFDSTTNKAYDIGIGKITHVPMVPLNSSGSNKQWIAIDQTPWTEVETNSLYLAGSKPVEVSLGRGEPASVILEKLSLYSTYNKGNVTLAGFVDYAWNDPQLKYDLLDKALSVNGYKDGQAWLKQFGAMYAGFDLPTGYSLVSGETPSLVNNTLFTPISKSTDTLANLDLSGKAPASSNVILNKTKYETNLGISASLMALIFPIPLFSTDIPLHKPVVTYKVYGSRKQGSGGPLTGDFNIYFDENRNLSQELTEPYSKTNPQSPTLDLAGSSDRMLLDTSAISNTVWDGKDYVVRYQDNRPDWRSGLLVIKPNGNGSVVDVMTGLVNSSTYISRLEKSVSDTHWETIKNSLLLDYIPFSFKDVETVATGRWLGDRQALTKLVPEEISNVFKQSLLLPAGLDADLSNPTSVYQGFINAASASQPNLLAQYKFETQMMVVNTLIKGLYAKLNINRSQLVSSNTTSGYDSEILADQVIPYLAFTLAGKTHSDYKKLVELLCDSIGGARASQIKSGLGTPGSVKLDLSQAADVALVLAFAQTTLPQTDFFQNDWINGRLKLTASGSIKTALQQMKLLDVATSITNYLKAWDTISTNQYAANPLLVTTAVSEIKREILKDGGVISKAINGIITKTSSGITAPTAWQNVKPLDTATFIKRNEEMQTQAALSQVLPGVAGMAKAQVVNQVFSDSDSGIYEFTLRLNRPAPDGGAVLLLGYQGSAVYGTDYTINGLSTQPQYLYVPSGETTQKVTIDVSKSKGVSSLLLQLQNSSSDFKISSSFNRMLFEIGNGKAQIFEQKDNVRSLSGDQEQVLPTGENIFAIIQDKDPVTKQEPKVIGSQPNLVDAYKTVSSYVSTRNPKIIKYATSAPSDSELLGGWTVQSKDLFRVYEGDGGPVDIVELKNTATGVYTYLNDQSKISELTSKNWISNGIVFSLDYDRSLPLAIKTVRDSAPVGTVPNMSLAGIKGYLDTYTFAQAQDISEWRFFASVKNLSFNFSNGSGGSGPITLNGDLMLRKRHEYTTDTFWISAAASGFALPSLATTPASNTASGQVDLRLAQETGQAAVIDQWRIQAAVKNYQFTNSLKLDGSIDLSYEKSAATNQKTRFTLAANIKNLSFSESGINLKNVEANVKKLVLEDSQLTTLNLDAAVQDLQIADQFKVTGSLGIEYSKSANKTSLKGTAEIKDFGLKIGDSGTVSVTKGSIGFSVLNSKLETASLSIEAATLSAGPQLAITMASGSVELVQSDGVPKSLTVKASLTNSNIGPLAITAANLDLTYNHIDAVLVKNGSPLPARDELKIDLSKTSGNLTLVEDQSSINFTDASANLLLVNGSLRTYNISTGPLEMSLGIGINLSGSLSLKNEFLRENNIDAEYIYAYTYATGLSIDFEGFKLNGSGEIEATIRNKKLKTLHLAASITDLNYKGFKFAGFADLNLDDTDNNGTFETVAISAGISELKIDLLGSTNQPLFSGEIQDLLLVNGDIKSWKLTGAIDAFNLANLFTASGYADLSYSKTVVNLATKEQITGTIGIKDFSLTLPGNSNNSSSPTKVFGELSFDWYDNALHQWKLSAGVTQLQLAQGFSISGDVSLEYQDANYDSNNSYGLAFYRLNATLEEAMITLKQGDDPLKVSGNLSNLVVTTDGTIHSWTLAASVQDLNLFGGFKINGNLSLDYKRTVENFTINQTYAGWAEISQFNVATAGVSTDPGSSLNGKLAFTSINGSLKDWTLSAKAKNLTVLNTFHIDGELEMSTTTGNPSLHTVKANIQELNFKVANKLDVTMAGQLDLSYKTPDGSIYAVEQDWKLKASRVSMSVSDGAGGQIFSLNGDAYLSYNKKLKYDSSLSVSEMEIENEDFTVSANVNNLKLKLPDVGNQDISLSLAGKLDASFDDGDLTKLDIASKVNNLKIKDFTFNGGLKLSYLSSKHQDNKAGEDTFKINGDFDSLSLKMPTTAGNNTLLLSSGNVGFIYGSNSGITAWNLEAKVTNLTLFNAVTFSGSTGISYEKKTIQTLTSTSTQEIFNFYATVTDFTLNTVNNQNLKLSGAFKLQSIDGAMDSWSMEASAKGLQWMGLALDGQFDVAYALKDSLYNNAETLRVSKASLNTTGISGLLQDSKSSLVISDVLISKDPLSGGAWTTLSWKAQASLEIKGPDIPFELKAGLTIDYLKYDPAHFLQGTYTLKGGVSDFKINSDLISLKNASLSIKNMVILEGQSDPIQALSIEGKIEELSIAKILNLSGDFLINYVNSTTKSVTITGNIDDLSITGFNIFNDLGLDSGSISATYSSTGDLSVDLTIKLTAGAHLKLSELDLGLGGSDLTLSYRKNAIHPNGSLGLAGNGHMTLGSTDIAVDGSFQASIDLGTGKASLDSASLNLTPDNQPVKMGLIELEAPTSLLYAKNDKGEGVITLQADSQINARLLNQIASPIYNTIDTMSPALKPVVDLLTYQVPNDIKTKEIALSIPAIKIPSLVFTGWRSGLFGIKFPTFRTDWIEVTPEIKTVIAPSVDIGTPLTYFLESYNGNPYQNGELEIIELIDGLGAAAFYTNQKLAQLGLGDAFEPYVAIFGDKAYTMDYPALSPIVGTIDKLLKLAAEGKQTLTQEWLDLPAFDAQLNLASGNLNFSVANNQENVFADIVNNIGAFGKLHSFVNKGNPIPAGPTAPQETPGTSHQLGFTDNSSLRTPFLDSPIKSLLDFVLDKPLDLFEYNLDITGSLQARASVDLGSWLAAVIGVPIPLILGGNVGLSANLDTTIGFTASSKAIKDIALSIGNLFSNNGTGSFDQVYKTIVAGVTEANRGVYLDISKDFLTLKPEASIDLSLDYKVVGLRAQIGLATTLSAALKLLAQPPKLIDIKAWDTDTNDGGLSPTNEVVSKAFDSNKNSKYLNAGGKNSGFRITLDQPSNFASFTIVTGNDAAGRDPASVSIRARNNDTDNWTNLASNLAIVLPTSRNSESSAFNFSNSGYYSQYEITFPTLRSESSTLMQLSEFRFTPKTNTTATNNSRIYLTNLIMPLFDPNFKNGKLANDLVLSLKPGTTTFWLDFLAKVASPWFSLLRLEAGTSGLVIKALGQTIGQTPGLPLPKISLDVPLGTVYTGPTYGPTALNFGKDILLTGLNADADLLTDFRSGVADQKGLFDRIGAELASDSPRGFLTVATSPYSRDVLTAIPRSLLLFDAVTEQDPTPDVLNVITSLDSTTALLAAHATSSSVAPLSGSILSRILGFSDEMAGNQSSYTLLGSSNSGEQGQGLSKLIFEYQLQTVLLAIQDQIRSSNGKTAANLTLSGYDTKLPKDESLWPYILLHQYLTSLPSGTNLDLSNANSLKGLFASIETILGTTGSSAGTPTAGFLADLVQRLCDRITDIAQTSEAVDGPALLAPIALSGLKQLIQSHTLEGYLRDLRQGSGNAQAIQNLNDLLQQSFASLMTMPRSAATGDRFADLGWAIDGSSGQVSLNLDHASNELGAITNLWIDSNLVYGVDYRLKGYNSLPQHLVITPGDDHLDLTIEVLNSGLSGASLNLHLLGSSAGIQLNPNSQVLEVSITGSTATSTVASTTQVPLPLTGSKTVQPDAQGVFTLTSQSGPPYLLVGFDPLLGHRIDSSGTTFASDELRIIDGVLHAGTKAIGVVLSATLNGRDLLSYADQLAPSTPDPDAGQTWRSQEQAMQEDQPHTVTLSTLLNGLGLSNQAEVLHLAATPRLKVTLSGDTLTITPEADVNGKGSVVLSILDGGKLSTLVVPLNVVGTADAPVLLQPIELSMNEDGTLTIPEGLLGSTIVDRDVFGDVQVLDLVGDAGNSGSFTITHNSADHTFTIQPAADLNGSFAFDLQVQSSSGNYNIDKALNLTVKPVDDLPEARGVLSADLTGRSFLRIQDSVIPNGEASNPQDRTLGLVDGDSQAETDEIIGIRITGFPASGKLRWQTTPPSDLNLLGNDDQAFDLIVNRLVTIDDLKKGRLIYRPDDATTTSNRLSDLFTFVIVQQRNGSTIESSPYTLNIGDNLDDEIAGNDAYNASIKRPNVVSSNISFNKQTDQVSLSISFDQAMSLEGGDVRVWLKDPAKPTAAPVALTTISQANLTLSTDKKSLTINFDVPKDVEGLLSFDLTSRGDVLKNSMGVSLTGDPDQFSVLVDTLPPVLLNNLHSDPSKGFSVKGPSMLLNLEFSNPVVSSGNARLSYRNPYTGQVGQITTLRPSTTPLPNQTAVASTTVTFDFGTLVNDLVLTPGETYTLILDDNTGLKDPGDNSTEPGTLSLDLKVPYPDTDAFKDAEQKARTAGNAGDALNLKPATFYLSVQDTVDQKDQLPVVIPFGQLPKGITVNAGAFSISQLSNRLSTDKTYNLSIKLLGSAANELSVNELELLFPRQEIWFDPYELDQLSSLRDFSISRDANNASLGILKLRLSGSGSLAQGSNQLLSLPFRSFPRSDGAEQQESAPALILRNVIGTQKGSTIKTSDLNLPELLLKKANSFISAAPLMALGDDSYTISTNSAPLNGDLFIRSLKGLKSTEATSISTAPTLGTLSIDRSKDLWTYKPNKDAVGSDSFTIRIKDKDGNQSDHTVAITIKPTADKHALITPAEEQALAQKLNNNNPDSNGDGKDDSTQGNIAVLPWRTNANFQDPNASTGLIRMLLPDSSAQINTSGNPLNTPNLNNTWEFKAIEVLTANDSAVGGGAPAGVVGSWDPLSFSLTSSGAGSTPQTTRVWLDLSSGNYPISYFNGYRKYVSETTIQDYLTANLPLKDLSGKTITTAGWYDFNQRRDANGNPVGDGARLISSNGRIQGLELTLTDNAFGDSDPTLGVIKDPGSLVLTPQIRLNLGQLSSTVVASTTANGLPELQFLAAPGQASQFRVFSPTATVNGSGVISGSPLSAGQHYKVEEITIDSDRSAYVIQFLDADTTKAGAQFFGTFFQGLATGNSAATADGIYRISLGDNIQLGSFTLKTNQLSQSEYNRLSCFHTLSLQKNNYSYFSALYGFRNTNLPSNGDDVLIGKSTANLTATSRDTLNGLAGNDLINGYGNRFNTALDFNATTNPIDQFGRNQKDILTGGAGRDIFQLADGIGSFYQGDGNQGYAVITDFSTDDSLILSGSASDYTLTTILTAQQSPVGVAGRALYQGNSQSGDLIAILQGSGSSGLQLNPSDPSRSQVQWL